MGILMEDLNDRIEQHARKNGSKRALICGNEYITYEELQRRTSQVATFLFKRGIKKEDIVPVYLPRSMDYIVAMLGILKAGAAFVSLSTEFPKDRIEYIVKDCNAKFIFNQEMLIESQLETPLLYQVEKQQKDVAFVIYTSGSTGNPKGIIYEHECFINNILKNIHSTNLFSDDIVLSNAPFYFIAFILDIMSPLWRGCTVHIASDEMRKDIRKVEDYIEKHQITNCFISPQLLKYFKNRSSSLRFVWTASERVSKVYSKEYKIFNLYGSSECVAATEFEIDTEYDNTPIGKPTEGRQVYILDEEGNEVPDGEEGEICISGFMARGYNNMQEETERAFRKNHFSMEKDSRLFYSGDIGKKLSDGNILYINRKDWMVKINGQRVEPGEIERCMEVIEEIEVAVVKGFENNGQTYLCGYYKCKAPIEEKQIIEALLKKLPEYMLPRFFVELDKMPINANGKLDRKSLQPLDTILLREAYKPPESDLERKLCQAFSNVLGQEQIGMNDDFFRLGGDSILIMKLIMAMEKFGIKIKVSDLYKYSTPMKIAAFLEHENIAEFKQPYSFEQPYSIEENTVYDFGKEHAKGVKDLFLENYGEKYPIKVVYNEEKNVKLHDLKEYFSVVAKDRNDKIIALSSIFVSTSPNSKLFEAGCLITSNNYRQSDITMRVAAKQVEENYLKERGIEGLFLEASAYSVGSQVISDGVGFVATAIEPALMLEGSYAKEGVSGRVGCVFMVYPKVIEKQEIFVPQKYAEDVKKIYKGASLTREVNSIKICNDRDSYTQIHVTYLNFAQVIRYAILSGGEDLKDRIEKLEDKDCAVSEVFVSMKTESVLPASEILEQRGYFFAGIAPIWNGYDAMLFVKLNVEPDFENLHTATKASEYIKCMAEKNWKAVNANDSV